MASISVSIAGKVRTAR